MSQIRYGMPYQGSKNAIAKELISFLPSGKRLCDLCGGGGAITCCAMETIKWDRFLYNEINPLVVKGFGMAMNGDYNGETRWISREEFNALKKTDPYVAMCFSFANNMSNYAYRAEIEPWKKALHYARLLGDYRYLEEFGIYDKDVSRHAIQSHIDEYREKYYKWLDGHVECSNKSFVGIQHLESLERLQRLKGLERIQNEERLNGIQSMKNESWRDRLEIRCGSYIDYQYEEGDVVYLDIPYQNTDCKAYKGFDFEEFYEWASTRPYQVFFSSYELDDDRFHRIFETRKRVCVDDNTNMAVECLYSNEPYKESLLGKQGLLDL